MKRWRQKDHFQEMMITPFPLAPPPWIIFTRFMGASAFDEPPPPLPPSLAWQPPRPPPPPPPPAPPPLKPPLSPPTKMANDSPRMTGIVPFTKPPRPPTPPPAPPPAPAAETMRRFTRLGTVKFCCAPV